MLLHFSVMPNGLLIQTAPDRHPENLLHRRQIFAAENVLEQARRVMAVLEGRQRQNSRRIAVHNPVQRNIALDLVGIEVACRINHRPTAVLEAV